MKVIAATFTVVLATAASLAQSPQADTPLLQIPYTPSLDVSSMDKSADPCVSLYQYACGGWVKNNPIPADQASWSVYGKLAQYNQRLLWGIAKADADMKDRTPVQQKVGDYYSACMNTAAIDALETKPLQPWLAKVDAVHDLASLNALVAEAQSYGVGLFFDAGSQQDYDNAESVIVDVGAGGLGLPDRDYYTKTDTRSVEIRTKYQAYVAQMLTLAGESPEKAKDDAAKILAFETTLAEATLTRVEMRDPHNLSHHKTLAELQSEAPSVDWAAYLAAVGQAKGVTINVDQPKFQKVLSEQLKQQPMEFLRAYMRFHLINGTAAYLAAQEYNARFDFYSKYLRGVEQMPPRWKKCVREEDEFLGEALGQEFVRVAFSANAKEATVRMTDQIETAMGQEIEKLDWMSPATKQQALAKLHNIRNKVGYPDKWRDYSALEIRPNDYFGNATRAVKFESDRQWRKVGKPLDRTEWGMTPPTVNAYFNGQMNDINFPAGVLQPPLYDPKSDDAPNYGNTGGTIGHELTHGFDDEGRMFDANGNLKDWWTPEDAKNFTERVECVQKQYSGYTIVDDIHINGKLTSGEDVADLGGELLGYIAWKAQTANMKLQDMDGFTPDQRFFIGFAQWACESDRPADKRARAITDPHSPGEYRIDGVAANMPEFRKAFGCKTGQPEAPAKMCRVW